MITADVRTTERYATAGATRVRCAESAIAGIGARTAAPFATVIAPWSLDDRKPMTQVDTHLPRPPDLTP